MVQLLSAEDSAGLRKTADRTTEHFFIVKGLTICELNIPQLVGTLPNTYGGGASNR